jgi:hypothetical protein
MYICSRFHYGRRAINLPQLFIINLTQMTYFCASHFTINYGSAVASPQDRAALRRLDPFDVARHAKLPPLCIFAPRDNE